MRGAYRPLPTEEGGRPFICGGEPPPLVAEGRGRAEALIEAGSGLRIGSGSHTLTRPRIIADTLPGAISLRSRLCQVLRSRRHRVLRGRSRAIHSGRCGRRSRHGSYCAFFVRRCADRGLAESCTFVGDSEPRSYPPCAVHPHLPPSRANYRHLCSSPNHYRLSPSFPSPYRLPSPSSRRHRLSSSSNRRPCRPCPCCLCPCRHCRLFRLFRPCSGAEEEAQDEGEGGLPEQGLSCRAVV